MPEQTPTRHFTVKLGAFNNAKALLIESKITGDDLCIADKMGALAIKDEDKNVLFLMQFTNAKEPSYSDSYIKITMPSAKEEIRTLLFVNDSKEHLNYDVAILSRNLETLGAQIKAAVAEYKATAQTVGTF